VTPLSTTKLEGEPHAPVGKVVQFFYRATNRGEQFRAGGCVDVLYRPQEGQAR
jgi:hypothetical protein